MLLTDTALRDLIVTEMTNAGLGAEPAESGGARAKFGLALAKSINKTLKEQMVVEVTINNVVYLGVIK